MRRTSAGIGVLNAAPYGGGMLAKGPGVQAKYAYGDAGRAHRATARADAAACARGGRAARGRGAAVLAPCAVHRLDRRRRLVDRSA